MSTRQGITKIIVVTFLWSSFLLFGQNFALAKGIEDEVADLKRRIMTLETRLADQEEKLDEQSMPGDDYGKAGNPDHNEGHFEAYYNIHINDNLSISPDLQVIWNPKGVGSPDQGRDDTIVVLGLRTQVNF
ncbi:MAG: carbohydrate porin [Candidatus Omnitrophica bacterium]|nr:carbohydrate porin [Candidatus Omnitrophota bacterium]